MIKRGAVVIPARFASTRFPGKPLANIGGKPMIYYVYQQCVKAAGQNAVFVATDSDAIKQCVQGFKGNVIMTSENCLTGTDRIAEANNEIDMDFIINVQGDEPMIDPNHIKTVFESMKKDLSKVVNCFCNLTEEEISMPSVPKVVVSKSGRLIYMSRGGIPFDKELKSAARYKQVGIYGFSRDHLKAFANQNSKTQIEQSEDIEVLRFLEMDIPVQMVKVSNGSFAVDTPDDLVRARAIME